MTMAGSTEPIEMITVSDENIAIEEQLSRKKDGWVISFSLTSKCESPVAVRISVPMPNEPARLDTGFHPKHEPNNWEIRDQVLTFEDVVPAEEPLQILLGVVLVGDEDVSLSLSEPVIDLSQPDESYDEQAGAAEESPIFRSNAIGLQEEQPVDTEAPGVDDGYEDLLGGIDDESEKITETDAVADVDEPEEGMDGSEGVFDLSDSTDETASSLESEEPTMDSAFNMERLNELSQDIEEEPDDDSEADIVSHSVDERPESVSPADETRADHDSKDLLPKLIEELQSSEVDEEQLEVLREHVAPESSKSMDVRMQHIQSRMDDLAAYTEALEGLIDKHGTASEFMNEIETEFESINTQLADLRTETQSSEAVREEFMDRLEEVESSMQDVNEDLHARTENIYDELDSIRETVDSREETLESLTSSVDRQEAELDSVANRLESTEAEIRSEVSELSGEVADFEGRMDDHRATFDQRLSSISNEIVEVKQTVESDFDQLQREVESLAKMRDVFARAFDRDDLGGEVDAETAENEFEEATDPE